MTEKRMTREDCIAQLQACAALLRERGETRYPCRSDFSEEEVVAIKAFLGPWPRALEAAGLKTPRVEDRQEQNRQRRVEAKRRRNEQAREAKREACANRSEGGAPPIR